MVLEAGPDDLLGVIQVFRTNEADHGVDQEGVVTLGQAIAAGFHGHLVPAKVGIRRQFGSLAGFKVIDVRPGRRPLGQQECPGFVNHGHGHTEGIIALLGASNRLEDQIRRRAHLGDGIHLGRDMSQNRDLGGDLPFVLEFVKGLEDAGHIFHGVIDGIQAEYGIAAAQAEAFHDRGHDALEVIGRMIRLQAG